MKMEVFKLGLFAMGFDQDMFLCEAENGMKMKRMRFLCNKKKKKEAVNRELNSF
jgi:hypothetical protein